MENAGRKSELRLAKSCDADVSYLKGKEKEAQFYLGWIQLRTKEHKWFESSMGGPIYEDFPGV